MRPLPTICKLHAYRSHTGTYRYKATAPPVISVGSRRRGLAAGRGRTATKINLMLAAAGVQTSRQHRLTMGWLYEFMLIMVVHEVACMSGLVPAMP